MSDRRSLPDDRTLYDVLAEPAPHGDLRGETRITATKETLDDDQEGDRMLTLLDER